MRRFSFILSLIASCWLGTMARAQYQEPAFDVAVEADVVYATATGYWSHASDVPAESAKKLLGPKELQELDLLLDIYLPQGDTSATRPLFLAMHGGAFFMGNKNEEGHSAWCRHFASLGYVAVSIDYRLGFHLQKKSVRQAEEWAVEDAAKALSYLLGREDLRIDSECVFVVGTSAGAAMAMALAFDPPQDMPSCRIRAVGDLWGYVHDLSFLERASTPVIAFQSVKDPMVPYKKGYPMDSRSYTDPMYGTYEQSLKAAQVGLRFDHYPCPERGHRLQQEPSGALTPRFYDIQEKLTAFFAEALLAD